VDEGRDMGIAMERASGFGPQIKPAGPSRIWSGNEAEARIVIIVVVVAPLTSAHHASTAHKPKRAQ
jgi:hypothetical protein